MYRMAARAFVSSVEAENLRSMLESDLQRNIIHIVYWVKKT